MNDVEKDMPWLSEYKHYWIREEKVEGLDLSQQFSASDLLVKVKDLLKVTVLIFDVNSMSNTILSQRLVNFLKNHGTFFFMPVNYI